MFGDYEALLDANSRFDVIWSYQVVIHMSDEIARNAIAKIAPLLKPTGRFFITAILGDDATGAWMEYPCRTRPYEFFRQIAENNGLDVEQVPYDHPMLNNKIRNGLNTVVGFRLDEPAEEMSWGSILAGTHSAMLGPRRVFR